MCFYCQAGTSCLALNPHFQTPLCVCWSPSSSPGHGGRGTSSCWDPHCCVRVTFALPALWGPSQLWWTDVGPRAWERSSIYDTLVLGIQLNRWDPVLCSQTVAPIICVSVLWETTFKIKVPVCGICLRRITQFLCDPDLESHVFVRAQFFTMIPHSKKSDFQLRISLKNLFWINGPRRERLC